MIVVDNNSSDNSMDMIKNKFPSVILIENKKNLGFSTANNQGIKASKGKYILVLNPDTIILEDAIEKMVDFMDRNKNVGALGPKIFEQNKVVSTSAMEFPTVYTEIIYLLMSKRKRLNELKIDSFGYNRTDEVDALSGCCIMFRKEALKKAGLFDEQFFMYGEDVELCYRVKQSGYKNFFLPESQIIHYGGKSNEQNPEISIFGFISTYKLLKKIYGRLAAFIYRIASLFISMAKVILFSFFILFTKDKNRLQSKIFNYLRIIKFSILNN